MENKRKEKKLIYVKGLINFVKETLDSKQGFFFLFFMLLMLLFVLFVFLSDVLAPLCHASVQISNFLVL